MEALIKNAGIAWNPIGATRKRFYDGTLTVGDVLLPYIGVVIACNLFAASAQAYFNESILYAYGQAPFDHPLLGDFAQRLLSAIGPIVPALAVAILPGAIHGHAGRSAVVASVFVIAAGWAFYGAAIMTPIYFVAGTVASVDPDSGLSMLASLGIPAGLLILALSLFFWFRIYTGVLALPGGSVAMISIAAFGSILALLALVWMALTAMFGPL